MRLALLRAEVVLVCTATMLEEFGAVGRRRRIEDKENSDDPGICIKLIS